MKPQGKSDHQRLSPRGVILDLDGTVYLGEHALPGAVETIAALRAHGVPVVFVTNKPLEPASAYSHKLTRLGIPADPDDVVTSSRSLGDYLTRHAPHARLFVIGEPSLQDEMRQYGLELVEDPAQVEYVVAAFDRTFDYRKWNIAFQALKFHGAHLIATNGDRTCPVPDGEIPDCAGIIAALEVSSGKQVELISGKPSPQMIRAAAARLNVSPDQCLVVGDRLETDIAMGRQAGAWTALVLTGVSTRAEALRAPQPPDLILNNLGELAEEIFFP
jgi:arabinose operon protein AraL